MRCAEYVVLNGVPIYFFEHVGFRNLIEEANSIYNFISKWSVSSVLKLMEVEIDNIHRSVLKRIPACSATADVWTAHIQESYASLKFSSIDEDWKYQTCTWSFSRLDGRHRGVDLSIFI